MSPWPCLLLSLHELSFSHIGPFPARYKCLKTFALSVLSACNALPQDIYMVAPSLPPGLCPNIICSMKATLVEIPSFTYESDSSLSSFLTLFPCFILFHLFITNWHSMHDYWFTDGLTLSPTPVLLMVRFLWAGIFVHLFIAIAFTPHLWQCPVYHNTP